MNHPQFRWCGVVWCGSGVVEGALLGVDRLAAGEHPDELLDVAGLRLGPLGLADAVQDREAVLAGEDLEHRGGPRLRSQPRHQRGWHLVVGDAAVGPIGGAAWGERGVQSGIISGVAVSLKKKKRK